MFEWDSEKARKNLEKHGVSFEEAATAFSDPLGLDGPDVLHSQDERRYLRVARSVPGKVITIAYTLRRDIHGETKIRLISARPASRKEKGAYEKKS